MPSQEQHLDNIPLPQSRRGAGVCMQPPFPFPHLLSIMKLVSGSFIGGGLGMGPYPHAHPKIPMFTFDEWYTSKKMDNIPTYVLSRATR